MPIISVNGLGIAYEQAGQGPPLVLLHGIGSNARAWRRQLAGLADAYTVIAWDAPGYGKSADPPGEPTMGDWAEYLAGFLSGLKLPAAHLLGLSWGGILAQEFYGRYPERVLSLILADSSSGGGADPPSLRDGALQARLQALETLTPAEIGRARAPVLLSGQASSALIQEVAEIFAEIHPAAYRQAAIASSQADERPVQSQIKVPTLVLWGEYDRVTPRDKSEQVRNAIAGARLILIRNAGHVSNQEQPVQFNVAVREFLAKVAVQAPAG